jgi:hypothetical protein
MRFDNITRLRLAFAAIAVVLLLPLGWLLHSIEQRLETQRRLRHEVVAERIFDELERELTHVLEREAARPSVAYDDVKTRASAWEPFVVGYFKSEGGNTVLLASNQLDSERRQRLSWALAQVNRAASEVRTGAKSESSDAAKEQLKKATPEEVLRQLNRADEVRAKSRPVSPRSSPSYDGLGRE